MKREIEKIRAKYVDQSLDKMEQLRLLDKKCERPGKIVAYVVGILGTLIMGCGMSFLLVWPDQLMASGVLIGIVGIVFIILAYPMYKEITKQRRTAMADEILKLSNEIMEGK